MVKLLLKHRSSASEGPKVQFLIGTQNFSLSQACDNTKSIFFPWIKFMTVWEHRFTKSNWIIIIAIVMGSNRDHELLFFVCSWVILTAGKHLSWRRRKTLANQVQFDQFRYNFKQMESYCFHANCQFDDKLYKLSPHRESIVLIANC